VSGTYPFHPKVQAFLDLIAYSEGTSTHPLTKDEGYDVIVSGVDGMHTFSEYKVHPFANGRAPILVIPGPPVVESTASGRYQQKLRNWTFYKEQINLRDFGHNSQDRLAIQLMNECHAIPLILAGNVKDAITACSGRWASFPGNRDGQPGGKTMEDLLATYDNLLAAASAA
jgi:muramidase (phage lysozyme)